MPPRRARRSWTCAGTLSCARCSPRRAIRGAVTTSAARSAPPGDPPSARRRPRLRGAARTVRAVRNERRSDARGPRVPRRERCSRRCCSSPTPATPRRPRVHVAERGLLAPLIRGNSRITARDQTRFFLALEQRCSRHARTGALRARHSAQRRSITPSASAGGSGGSTLPGWRVYFKGGWGSGTGARRPPGRAARHAATSGIADRRPHRERRHPRRRPGDAGRRLPPPALRRGVRR